MAEGQVDVLVVGAGTSGIPAAVGAVRCGARVLLLEREPIPGGTITGSYVGMPCGGPRTGIYEEMVASLSENHSLDRRDFRCAGEVRRHNWFLPSSWLAVMQELVQAEDKVRMVCGVEACRPIVEDTRGRTHVRGVLIPQRSGEETRVHAKVTVDATGTGAIAHAAGCRSTYGREAKSDFQEPHAPQKRDLAVQQCTWMYISQRIGSGPPFDMMRLDNVRLGVLVAGVGWFHTHVEEALERDPGIHLHWGCAVPCRDTRDPAAVAEAQRQAHAAMERDLALLRENGHAVYLAPRLGIREGRRIVGDHVITENDLGSGRLPDDTIAIGTYGLDLWGRDLAAEERRLPCYGIPYRALLPKDVEGLILAGKSISGTHVAAGAYRVQPILASAGQAAGVAAALAARLDVAPRRVEPQDIRNALSGPGQNVCLKPPDAE